MALLGHSGSQAPQFIHSSVILIAMVQFILFNGLRVIFALETTNRRSPVSHFDKNKTH
jgi:hypothetical protein